jgi:hypothetical protein
MQHMPYGRDTRERERVIATVYPEVYPSDMPPLLALQVVPLRLFCG